MKVSHLFYPTLREVPSEAEIVSHQLLLRAGFIRKTSGGIYTYLPLALKVLHKIEEIIRSEMNSAGGQEILLPIIQPKELWEKTGRWSVYGDEMFRLKDRHSREFALGPTHEEIITALVDADVHSYRELPLLLYQIQNKYRDEIRPRFGLMRGREFIMKDLYSFDLDEDGLDISYQKMYKAYKAIFSRLKLQYRVVEADSGAIGGNNSHEFMVLAESGESVIVYCDSCDYAANVEKAECVFNEIPNSEELREIKKVYTPDQKTIHDIEGFLGIPAHKQIKTLIYEADGNLIAVLIRGDHELNEIKLSNLLKCQNLVMAAEERIKQTCGAGFGSLGPVGLNLKIYADWAIKNMTNSSCGANQDDYHYENVNIERDFTVDFFADLRNAVDGDCCPVCNSPLKTIRGIEVGHIFKLGTKYSQALQATYLDQEGNSQLMVMGCYGIGVSRTLAAAVEQNHDENGIIWPMPIAPYQVIIIPVNAKNEEQMQAAEALYNELNQAGIEVILDDRNERAGVKFKDADLIGIPLRITIGPKSLAENKLELKKRWDNEIIMVDSKQITDLVKKIIAERS